MNMMNEINYVIVEISGRQFWIEPSRWYDVNRIPTEVGKEIILNRVLLVSESFGQVRIGRPYLDAVKVRAKILKHLRGPKTIVYKMRPKKKTRKKQGHRQDLTRILIDSINEYNFLFIDFCRTHITVTSSICRLKWNQKKVRERERLQVFHNITIHIMRI